MCGEALNRIASFGFYPVLHVYEMDSQDYLLPDEVQKYVPVPIIQESAG